MEIRDLKGFEGLYKVGSDGVLYSVKSYGLKKLKGGSDGRYKHHSLRKDGKQYQRTLHSIVAETFIPNPEGKREVNHIDGNKLNNDVSNLEWVSRSENAKHAYANGMIKITDEHLHNMRKSVGSKNAKLSRVEAENLKHIYNNMKKPSTRRLAKSYGLSRHVIRRAVNGRQKYFRGDVT